MAEMKTPWKSKTLWTALIMALVPMCPPAAAFVAANPELSAVIVSGIFAGLRLVSNGKIAVE